GVKPGGLTSPTDIRILICYLLSHIGTPISRQQLEDVLLGESLVNYFVMADSLSQLEAQGLVTLDDTGYHITASGRTVGETLADELPRTIRELAVRGLIRAQQYQAMQAAHQAEVVQTDKGTFVRCLIGDEGGPLFRMELYMPDALTAEAVREQFVTGGDTVYKLVLAALTGNQPLAQQALQGLLPQQPE
ncbi:MAG: DUF4364 family protein, partial [Oscillospiraceae bacterium]